MPPCYAFCKSSWPCFQAHVSLSVNFLPNSIFSTGMQCCSIITIKSVYHSPRVISAAVAFKSETCMPEWSKTAVLTSSNTNPFRAFLNELSLVTKKPIICQLLKLWAPYKLRSRGKLQAPYNGIHAWLWTAVLAWRNWRQVLKKCAHHPHYTECKMESVFSE